MGKDSRSNLEMRCSVDEAWYDGSLSFAKDSNDDIVVHFNDFGKEEDEKFPASDLLDLKKLQLRVRVRSEQLQDRECKLVKEGQFICGCLDDGEDRKYYDAKVVSIVKKEHVFSNEDGEECKCDFKLLWLDGPKKAKQTLVGCAEVCFLSLGTLDENPMVKNLVKRLAEDGEQQRKLAGPKCPPTKDLLSPRLKALSSILDTAPSKMQVSGGPSSPVREYPLSDKQSSKELLPEPLPLKKQPSSKDLSLSTSPNHRVLRGQQASAKSQGSKKKRIMQAKVMEQLGLASDNDSLNKMDVVAEPIDAPKDPNGEAFEDAPSYGNEADDADVTGDGGESLKEEFALGRRRLIKAKNSKAVVAPGLEFVLCDEEASVRAVDKPISVPETLKSNARKGASKDNVARDEGAAITEEDDMRVKSNPKKMAPLEVTAPCDKTLAVQEDVMGCPAKLLVKLKSSRRKAELSIAPAPSPEKDVRVDIVSCSNFTEEEISKAGKKAIPDVLVVRDETVSRTLGERIKLKSLEKSKSLEATQRKSSKDIVREKKAEVTPQKKLEVGPLKRKEVAKEKVTGKQVQKQTQCASPLCLKPNEAAKPDVPSRSIDVAAPVSKGRHERTLRRPRKQPILELSEGHQQSSKQETMDVVISEKQTCDSAINMTKRPYEEPLDSAINMTKRPHEEPPIVMLDAEDICTDKATPEEDEALAEPQHIIAQTHNEGRKTRRRTEALAELQHIIAQTHNDDKKTRRRTKREQQPQSNDALFDKSIDNDKDHTPLVKKTKRSRQPPQTTKSSIKDDEDCIPPSRRFAASSKRLEKKSLAASYNAIVEKHRSNHVQVRECIIEETLEAQEVTTLGSSEELIGSPLRALSQVQEPLCVFDLQNPKTPATEMNASGKRRRRHVVQSHDEEAQAQVDAKKSKSGEVQLHGSVDISANGRGDCNDPKTTSTSALDEEVMVQEVGAKATSRLLLISNMEVDVSAHDVMQLLLEHTDGVCAVHVLPVGELQSSTVGYALYRDNEFALMAFERLAAPTQFVVSPNGRPWIISQSTNVYGPHLCGFAARTAFKSDDPGVCGIISDQPPAQELLVVTEQRDSQAYAQALERSKAYAEHQKWRKEVYERIVKDESKSWKKSLE